MDNKISKYQINCILKIHHFYEYTTEFNYIADNYIFDHNVCRDIPNTVNNTILCKNGTFKSYYDLSIYNVFLFN